MKIIHLKANYDATQKGRDWVPLTQENSEEKRKWRKKEEERDEAEEEDVTPTSYSLELGVIIWPWYIGTETPPSWR